MEDIQSRVILLTEAIGGLASLPPLVARIDERLSRVEADVKVIKAVVTGQSEQIDNHEVRITELENK